MSKTYNGEIRGTLHLKSFMDSKHKSTEIIDIHPINSGNWWLVPLNIIENQLIYEDISNFRLSAYYNTSSITFTTRQIWKAVYHVEENNRWWRLLRKDMALNMSESDFEYFFGKYEII